AAVTILFAVCSVTRRACRYSIYESATMDPPAYDVHPIAHAGPWPIWRALDDGEAHRIAVAAGWDGGGHNAYLYPLLGSHLQNRLVYVPMRADGRVQDVRLGSELTRAANLEAGLGRLESHRVDVLVLLAPPPFETGWALARPDVFTEVARSTDGASRAFRVNR